MRVDGRILLVDDYMPSLVALDELLRECGYVTTCATRATTALRRAALARPRLVCAEAELPDMGGTSFLRRLRALAPGCPVIMISAAAPFRLLEDGQMEFIDLGSSLVDEGAAAFFPKPIAVDRFLDCVANLVMNPCDYAAATCTERLPEGLREYH